MTLNSQALTYMLLIEHSFIADGADRWVDNIIQPGNLPNIDLIISIIKSMI